MPPFSQLTLKLVLQFYKSRVCTIVTLFPLRELSALKPILWQILHRVLKWCKLLQKAKHKLCDWVMHRSKEVKWLFYNCLYPHCQWCPLTQGINLCMPVCVLERERNGENCFEWYTTIDDLFESKLTFLRTHILCHMRERERREREILTRI